MKLNEKEQNEIIGIVTDFALLSDELEMVSSELDKIDATKKSLLESVKKIQMEVDKIRSKEKEFTDRMEKKYGPFSINMETFEIIPS